MLYSPLCCLPLLLIFMLRDEEGGRGRRAEGMKEKEWIGGKAQKMDGRIRSFRLSSYVFPKKTFVLSSSLPSERPLFSLCFSSFYFQFCCFFPRILMRWNYVHFPIFRSVVLFNIRPCLLFFWFLLFRRCPEQLSSCNFLSLLLSSFI